MSGAPPLLLIRHGQTPWNAAGRWQGHADPGLTPLGRTQACETAKAIETKGVRWLGILSSDLLRARETAEVLAETFSIRVSVDARLRELDVGRWSGETRERIAKTDPEALAAFDSGDPDAAAGGGESRRALEERVWAAVEDWRPRFQTEPWILVAHLGVLRVLQPGTEPGNAAFLETTSAALSAVLSAPVDGAAAPAPSRLTV